MMMTRSHDQHERIPWPEWVMAGIGAVLVLATVGWLVADFLRQSDAPPAITLHVDTIARTPHGYVVQITAHNTGGQTAAAARIEGELFDGRSESVEQSEVTLDYLPRQSRRELGLIFENDPGRYRLKLRATGYREP